MKDFLVFIALFLTTLSFTSCSKEEIYTPIDMYMMATRFDPKVEEVRIVDPSRSLSCDHYFEGCIKNSPKRFKIRLVEMVVVQFHNSGYACKAALKLNQYYTRNWLFDDVTDEPVLEDFVKKVWDAKNPKKPEDCN